VHEQRGDEDASQKIQDRASAANLVLSFVFKSSNAYG